MEFNQENIEAILNDGKFVMTTSGLNNSMEKLQVMKEEAIKAIKVVMQQHPEASHDEIVQLAIEEFERSQQELSQQAQEEKE